MSPHSGANSSHCKNQASPLTPFPLKSPLFPAIDPPDSSDVEGKMDMLTLLIMTLTISGYSYSLPVSPRLAAEEVPGLNGDPLETEGLTPETYDYETTGEIIKRYDEGSVQSLIRETLSEILEEARQGGGFSAADVTDSVEWRRKGLESDTGAEFQTNDSKTQTYEGRESVTKQRQEVEEEEKESKLVAGLNLHEEQKEVVHTEGQTLLTANQGNVDETKGNEDGGNRGKEGENIKDAKHTEFAERKKGDGTVVNNLTPPTSTSSTEIAVAIQIITGPPNPPASLHNHHHNVSSSVTVTPTPASTEAEVSHHLTAAAASQVSVSALAAAEVLQQNELDEKTHLDDILLKNMLFKPAQKATAREINLVIQPKEAEFIPEAQATTVKPTKAKFITRGLKNKESESSPKTSENDLSPETVGFTLKPNMTQLTGKPRMIKLKGNDTKLKASTTTQTPSTKSTKNRSSKKTKEGRVTTKKLQEKKKKKDNRTQKFTEKKTKVTAPTHFPYFKDNYCPPDCACYGRVVQCSDKGADKIPYGIPYNARYVLLMNNQIDSIQLDLLSEYVSMEFLVLSNNRLTDGAIEGAFEGIPALKRLYLDKNLLQSVPTDLPLSLEELRLDNNRLSVMSEAAWARCTNLLVLSLSNNSLGNGSDSLPNAVLSPLSHLRTLNLDHNQLTSVPQRLPLSVKELYLKGNLIEQFRGGAFTGVSELLVLDLSSNKLTNKGLLKDSLLNATHLESLNLEGNRLKQIPRHLPHSLKTLNLEGNLISSVKKAALSTLKNLEHLGLARNKIFKVAPGAFKALPVLHQLDLCHNTLRQVPRQLPQALHSVALTHNRIQSVPRDAFCWGNRTLSLSRLVRVQLENNLIDMGKLNAQAFRCLRGFQLLLGVYTCVSAVHRMLHFLRVEQYLKSVIVCNSIHLKGFDLILEAHLLDLGHTRSESNYPIGPRSHFSLIPPLDWIFGSQAHLCALCLAFTENRLPANGTMRSACLSLLLVTACWALPFRQSGFLDFMMEDEGSAVTMPPVIDPFVRQEPKCPFRCQCHLRVIQCSDLGLKEVPKDIPDDTTLLDLQNNKITEIKENDFQKLKGLHALILVNNKITSIHPKALTPLTKLQRLYLSKNKLKDVPINMPKSLQELRIHENEITKIKKASFQGMAHVIVMELGSNPLKSAGVDDGAFADLKRVSYIRIADTDITDIPKGLPSSLSELHLDGNKITKVTANSLQGLKNLAKLGLSYNEIGSVENGTLANVPHLRELHLDNNALTTVPPGLSEHKYIQVVYLHANKIGAVGTGDFCPPGLNTKKASYSGISLFSNPVPYWEVQPITFRCVFDRSAIQLGNYRKK
ncbi:uncharacterized protein V6R79_013312 [Siganus canaliculatus]